VIDIVKRIERFGGTVERRALYGCGIQCAGIGAIEAIECDWRL
jgi:hypothetical protein